MDRRKFLKRAGVLSTAGVTSAACSSPALTEPAHENEDVSRFGNPLPTECHLDRNGEMQLQPGIRMAYSRCFSCFNLCGLRARIDEASDKILKVSGNPYCENNSGSPLALSIPVRESHQLLSGESGLTNRATTCAKGASSADAVDDERRITQVLKRAGKRGEGKWKTISYEQALKEMLEGGDLFGEGHVDGLKAIRKLDEQVKPGHPEFGSKANQLFATYCSEDITRGGLYMRFMLQSWGTSNIGNKDSYCGAQQAFGFGMGIDLEQEEWLNDVDWPSVEYALFMGTSPGSSGVSLNYVGRGLADSRTERKLKYVCVDPLLRTTVASNTNATWLAIKPGQDAAFSFGVIRTMLEEGWFNKRHLECASQSAAKKAGELNYTNAGYLVIMDEHHHGYREFAKASDFGLGDDEALMIKSGSSELISVNSGDKAELFVDTKATDKNGHQVRLVSSLALLRAEAQRTSMTSYAKKSGIGIKEMRQVAKDLGHYGSKACVAGNTGANSSDGFVVGWLWAIMNTLVGSHDAKGGSIYGNGPIDGYFGGLESIYDLNNIEGGVDLEGVVNACRDGIYEESTEYKQKITKGVNPYPASTPWNQVYPTGNAAEQWASHTNADPYQAKAFFVWRNNFLYAAASVGEEITSAIADPKQLPLVVGIDCHMNETNRFADYFIPDRVMHEEYAADRMWGPHKLGIIASAPIVTPRTVKTAKGEHVCMEQLLIDIAVEMQLPGFGKQAISTTDGRKVDLLSFDDWNACYLANIANKCSNLPHVSDEDRRWAGLDYAMKSLKPRLLAHEAAKVEALLSRGGYYEEDDRYDGEYIKGAESKCLPLYHPHITKLKHSYSGEHFPGIPTYAEHKFWNGDTWDKHWDSEQYPLVFSSYKPTTRSNYCVAYKRIAEISPTNYVYMNLDTAKAQNLKDKDKVKLMTPNGLPAEGILQTDSGVAPGAICISMGFGHTKGFGGDERVIDSKVIPAIKARATGTAVNQMIPSDPTRPGKASLLRDYWTGATCRHGIPVKVVKVS